MIIKRLTVLLIFSFIIPVAYNQSVNNVDFENDHEIAPAANGPYALVAGGSKGIGYAIAEALAKRHYNLILIARHFDSLQSAKTKLETAYNIHVDLLRLDLEHEKTADSIAHWCNERNIPLKVLCNVAGLGGIKDYLTLQLDSLRYMVRLNVESAMALTLTLLPLLEKNSPSYILNVASMAGFAPIPVKNMYSATKSAVIFFSYSLRYQLREKHISVSCLAPGPVFTKPSIEQDTKEKLGWLGVKMAVPPKKVGEIADVLIKKSGGVFFQKQKWFDPGLPSNTTIDMPATGIIFGREMKTTIMKGSRQQETKQSKQGHSNKPIPEIRDDMDSRHNKEDNKNNVGISMKKGNKEPKK